MINITDENLIKVITTSGRTFTGKILLGINTYDSILNIKYKAPFSASGALSIGETPSAMIDVEMTDISPELRGMELEAVISIEGQDFSQGLFTVDEPTEKDGVVKFTAYDRMNSASGETYVSELTYPTTVQAVFDEVCAQLGYTAGAVAESDNIEVASDVLSGYDCRTALGYLAAYIGKNCVCGIDGIFRMKGFAVQNVTVDEDTISEAETGKQASMPRYLSCTVSQDTVYTSGEGKQGISFVCPLMTQERLDKILGDLIGTDEAPGILRAYHSADITQLCGDPRIETGDIITLECYGNVYSVPVMNVDREFDGGLSCKFNSYEPVKEINLTLAQKVELLKQETINQKNHFSAAQTTLTESVMSALGLYSTSIVLADGSTKYYFHNEPTLETSTYIVTITSNGFAFTTGLECWNGGDPQWKYGVDAEGNAVLNTLALHGLTADWIKAGTLQSLNGSTFFNLDEGEIGSEQTEEAVYIFGHNASVDDCFEKTLKKTSKLSVGGGSIIQSVNIETVPAEGEESEIIDAYALSIGMFGDTQKGITYTYSNTYYERTGRFYFKKPDDWDSKNDFGKSLVLLTNFLLAQAFPNGFTLNNADTNEQTTISAKGVRSRTLDKETGNYRVSETSDKSVLLYSTDANGNVIDTGAGIGYNEDIRKYMSLADSFTYPSGATAGTVFTQSLGIVSPTDNEPVINLTNLMSEGKSLIHFRLTLSSYYGCSEYIIYFHKTNEQIWVNTKYVTASSNCGAKVYGTPVIKGFTVTGEHNLVEGTEITVSTKGNGNSYDGYTTMTVEILHEGG